jgi:hypothetical protein
MRFHSQVLGTTQQRVLGHLGPVLTSRGFYLGGGTALAVQLGHRRSVDLDWFTSGRLGDPLRLAADLGGHNIAFTTHQHERGTLHGTVSGVRVSLLEYPYRPVQPTIRWRAFACDLASMADLAAMKLSAQASRGARKDFVDLYAVGRKVTSLGRMLEWYREKFNVQDLAHVLYSLVYFDEANRQRMPRMLWDVNWRTIKNTLRTWVKELTT